MRECEETSNEMATNLKIGVHGWIVGHSSFSILSPGDLPRISDGHQCPERVKTALSQMKDESWGGGHWEATDHEA